MIIEIFKLFGSILIDDKEASNSLSKIDKKSEGVGKRLGSMIGIAAKWGAAIGAGAAVAGGALFAMANKAAGTTDRIDKLSQKIGLSRQGFQEWEFIMSQSGASVEGLQMGFKTLVTQIDQAVAGTGKGAESFEKLGISVTDANGAVKDQETIFNEAVVALQGMEEGTEKAKLANDLFGRSGAELMPLLNGAAGSVEDMKNKAHDLGLILSDEAVDSGVLFTDTMDQMKRAGGALFANIGVDLIPIFQKMSEWIMAHMPEIQAGIQTAFGIVSDVIGTTIDVVKSLTSFFQEHWNVIQPIVIGIASLIAVVLIPQWIAAGVKATISAAKQVAAWISTQVAALKNAAVMVAQSAIVVAKWMWMGAQSLLQAGRMAAAWLIAMGPIAWVIAAIVGLVALIIANWDTIVAVTQKLWSSVKEFFVILWEDIKDIFFKTFEWLKQLFLDYHPLGLVIKHWDTIKESFQKIWDKVKEIFIGTWDSLKTKAKNFWGSFVEIMRGPVNLIIGMINTVIGAYESMINGLGTAINKIPSIKIPDWVPKFGGKEFGIPDIPRINLPEIPMLEDGGDITEAGRVLVGENAPEFLDLPKGARVTPLDHSSINQNPVIHTTINVDGRKVAEATSRPNNDMVRTRQRGTGVLSPV